MSELLDETTELTQQLIRNACVNDGSPTSGNEMKSAGMLAAYFDGSGVDLEIYEPLPGRGSLVATIEGSDPSAPTLLLKGGRVVAAGAADDVLTDDVVSRTFGIAVRIHRAGGRWTAVHPEEVPSR